MSSIADHIMYTQRINAWQGILDEVRLENIRLKNLLAVALSKDVSRKFVEDAEQFQQKFLDKEQVVDLLRHDISAIADAREWSPGRVQQLMSLERDVNRLDMEFLYLKNQFSRFIDDKAEEKKT